MRFAFPIRSSKESGPHDRPGQFHGILVASSKFHIFPTSGVGVLGPDDDEIEVRSTEFR